jgi:hypothetical protein
VVGLGRTPEAASDEAGNELSKELDENEGGVFGR